MKSLLRKIILLMVIILLVDFAYLALSKYGVINFSGTKNNRAQAFFGRVMRVLPKDDDYVLEVMDVTETDPAKRATKLFSVDRLATSSASAKTYATALGYIKVGDELDIFYRGTQSPYPLVSLNNNSTIKNDRKPVFLHGFVTAVSGDTLILRTTEGPTYTLKIEGAVSLGHKYEGTGSAERPGKLKPAGDFSSVKIGDEVSVYYTRNDGEFIVPDSVLII